MNINQTNNNQGHVQVPILRCLKICPSCKLRVWLESDPPGTWRFPFCPHCGARED